MAKLKSILKSTTGVLKRGAIGFVAGSVLACFALIFLGMLHPHNDLSQSELEQEYRSRWFLLYIACGTAVFTSIVGKMCVSRFALWFSLAFAAICVIPFWPHKDGSLLLPYGTPYVNGYRPGNVIILAVHVSMAVAVAAISQWLLPRIHQRKAP